MVYRNSGKREMAARPVTSHRKAKSMSLPIQLRPQSAAGILTALELTSRDILAGTNGEQVGATSNELIRNLEQKVRKIVELKRVKSDKLRFEVLKKREEVEKAKLVLQDLIKDSKALGLHYTPSNNGSEDGTGEMALNDRIVEEANRLQPITAISRRPFYSKHTKINELEAKLQKQAQASHEILRSTMVLEHIKKRLLIERNQVTQDTNELKTRYTALNHQTLELQKKELSASEAVSQIQTRLAQQKAKMAANMRKHKREVDLRHKWSREKAKFEKYYNNQMQALLDTEATTTNSDEAVEIAGAITEPLYDHPSYTSNSVQKIRRDSASTIDTPEEMESEEMYRKVFLRMGFGHDSAGVDPNEVIQMWHSQEEIIKELDAKHDEDMGRIAVLRDQLVRSKNAALEIAPLSKRDNTQRLETKEIEISSARRALATVVDQYMFVDRSVRPLKIGLQQILQNVTNITVNIDDMKGIEHALFKSIEEMMKLARQARYDSTSLSSTFATEDAHFETSIFAKEENATETVEKTAKVSEIAANFATLPFNIRIPPMSKEASFILDVNETRKDPVSSKEVEEADSDVMDRSALKRISSVLVCSSTEKNSLRAEKHAK
ncbi:uncharacterized protein PHALS_11409 [Plasmopara halstedii]|uniref:Uncharacterized protein n=1 Tax=Plasmopara halstedii TaxID=4781 RepID=A0A0P1A4W2_PLAHL|nr:uncharacterized protein PHALS_11409 [Plasmopara halstedii]CEG35532.1 hypothetical protein PHALS_11409 [Plasmopara halstedii]|eukprot:XP_024571901.1 hypothetical protein PHALS_11409 [Plasmopara halstedii]